MSVNYLQQVRQSLAITNLAESTDRSSMLARGFIGISVRLRGEEGRGAASLAMAPLREGVVLLLGLTLLECVTVFVGVAVLVFLPGVVESGLARGEERQLAWIPDVDSVTEELVNAARDSVREELATAATYPI